MENSTMDYIYVLNVSESKADNVTAQDLSRDEVLAQAEIATLALMFVVTVLGNVAVLLALSARPRKKLSRMYYFILHLSIADLFTAFLSILPQLAWDVTYRFHGGPFLCKLVKYGQTLGPYLSAYILMATALDRYQAVCNPLAYCSWTSRRSRFMVWTAWLLSLSFCIPQILVFSYQEIGPGVFDCWATFIQPWGERTYVTWYCISVFIIPFTVLASTYMSICREIWLHAGRSPQQQGNTSPLISRAKINTVKQMVAVLFLYLACSAPFICAQLWATWDPYAHTRPFFTGATFTILTLLYSLNSCMNPWIYLFFNRELLRFLAEEFICRFRDTAGYRASSAGSGSSTGDTAPTLMKRSFTKLAANSAPVIKTFEEDSIRTGSTALASPVGSIKENSNSIQQPTQPKVTGFSVPLFVRNSSVVSCRLPTERCKVASWCSAKHSKGLSRSGAIRKKNLSFSGNRSSHDRSAQKMMVTKDRNSFAYSFFRKFEKSGCENKDFEDGCASPKPEDEEPAVALLHSHPSRSEEGTQLQVHF